MFCHCKTQSSNVPVVTLPVAPVRSDVMLPPARWHRHRGSLSGILRGVHGVTRFRMRETWQRALRAFRNASQRHAHRMPNNPGNLALLYPCPVRFSNKGTLPVQHFGCLVVCRLEVASRFFKRLAVIVKRNHGTRIKVTSIMLQSNCAKGLPGSP